MGASKAELARWPAPIAGRCNFRKRDFSRCKAYPKKGEDRCRKHRRASGAAHPKWKGGTSNDYMKQFLPVRLMERFDRFVNDPEISSVRGLLGVTGTRFTELLEKLTTLESRAAWERFGECLDELELKLGELKEKDSAAVTPFVDEMRRHYKAAFHEARVWDEVLVVVEQHRKLADTEQKREAALQANLSARQTIALFNYIFQVLVEEIADLTVRRRIGVRLQDLLKSETPLQIEAKVG